MKIIDPKTTVEWIETEEQILKRLERIGRTAYKSEHKITKDSAVDFVKMIIKRGHLSVLEHATVSTRVICDRGISHEIVRHRIASYTQESTRYCNYSKDKHKSEITFVLPYFLREVSIDDFAYVKWHDTVAMCEQTYLIMVACGYTPQEARSVLPNSLKTEIVMTMNLREWQHFFKLRTALAAHPDMQIIANMILCDFRQKLPSIFGSFEESICQRIADSTCSSISFCRAGKEV